MNGPRYYIVLEDHASFCESDNGGEREWLHFHYAIYRIGSDRVVFRAPTNRLAEELLRNLNVGVRVAA